MSGNDSWAIFSDSPDTPPVDSIEIRLEPLAAEYEQITKKIDALSSRIEELQLDIARMFPETEGELSKTTENFIVSVSRSERWSWDKDFLEQEFGTSGAPDWIKRGLSVDKRKFQKLPKDEQRKYLFALTRKLDKAKVKVVPNV